MTSRISSGVASMSTSRESLVAMTETLATFENRWPGHGSAHYYAGAGERQHRPYGGPERYRLYGVRPGRRVVGAPAPVRGVWSHRVLRRFADAARVRALADCGPPD